MTRGDHAKTGPQNLTHGRTGNNQPTGPSRNID